MQLYRELAVAVDDRLQGRKRDSSAKSSSMDSGVTMLSGTERSSSGHPLCTNRKYNSGFMGKIESAMITSEDRTSLKSAEMKTPEPCIESEQRGPKTVLNSDLMSGSDNMLGTFKQDGIHNNPALLVEPTEQHVQHDCSEGKNVIQHVNVGVRDTRGVCLTNKDPAAQNSKTGGVHIKEDIIIFDKYCLENMEQSSGFTLTDSVFDSDCTRYKPWDKIHCDNTSSVGKTVLKLQQETVNGMSDNQQGSEETVASSDVNGNLVQSAQQRQINTGIHHSFIDNILTPIIHTVKLKSTSVISATDDHRQERGANNNVSEARGESIHNEAFTSQNQVNSKSPLKDVQLQTGINGTSISHSQKINETNTPIENVPCLSKVTYSSCNVIKPVKICEGIMDISDRLQSKSCSNDESVRLNTSETDRIAVMNMCSFSGHNSAESTGFTYVSSSTPHLLIQDNLEDSVSSAVMTSSTDLNHYMNTTGSSDSGSPERDVAAHRNRRWSGQDELNGFSDVAPLQRSLLSKNTFSRQHLQLTSISEPNLMSHHGTLTDQIEEQKCIQNFDDGKVRTSSNKENYCAADKVVVRSHLPDCLKMTGHVNRECAAHNFNECHKNVNSHAGHRVKCLTIPKVKLQHKAVDKHDDLETSSSPLNTFMHDSSSTEEYVNQISECNIPKPGTTPPRLVRQNSYTLVAPSPLLVAHIKMQNGKNSVHDMTESSNISTIPCRNARDLSKPRRNWEPNRKKGNSSFALLNGNTNSGKKINSSVVSSTTSASLSHQPQQNSSLPTSNASSPIKLRTPSASLDCLPSAMSLESVKTFSQPSPRMKIKRICKNSISVSASKETKTSKISQDKSPTKRLRKDIPMENPSMKSQGSPKKIYGAKTVPLSTQQDVQGLMLHLQSEHSRQMADLLAKQRMEQEELRKAFLQQQEELVLEVCKVYSATFNAPMSQKQLSQQTSPCDHFMINENRGSNSSMTRVSSDLSSKGLSPGSANTLERSTYDMNGKCVLLDTDFKRLTCSSPSADMGHNSDSLRDRTQGSKAVTHLQDSSHKDEPMEEVPQNALQDGNSLTLSHSDNIEKCLPAHSFHPYINGSTSPRMLVPPELDILQKHNGDCSEENARNVVEIHNVNCAAQPLSYTSGVVSNVPASETASISKTVNHSLKRTESEFPPDSVPSSLFVAGSNSVCAKDGQNDSIQERSPCVRQLFPALEEADILLQTSRNRSDLEKVGQCTQIEHKSAESSREWFQFFFKQSHIFMISPY